MLRCGSRCGWEAAYLFDLLGVGLEERQTLPLLGVGSIYQQGRARGKAL